MYMIVLPPYIHWLSEDDGESPGDCDPCMCGES